MTTLCAEIERFGKGIGNATRYHIIQTLLAGPRSVGELVEVVQISQSAMSQHLAKLKACNLVTDERHGQEVRYALNTEHILGLLTALIKTVDRPSKRTRRS